MATRPFKAGQYRDAARLPSKVRPVQVDGGRGLVVSGGPGRLVVRTTAAPATPAVWVPHRSTRVRTVLPAVRRGRIMSPPGATVAPTVVPFPPHLGRRASQLPAVRRGRRLFAPPRPRAPLSPEQHDSQQLRLLPAARRSRLLPPVPAPAAPTATFVPHQPAPARTLIPAQRRGRLTWPPNQPEWPAPFLPRRRRTVVVPPRHGNLLAPAPAPVVAAAATWVPHLAARARTLLPALRRGRRPAPPRLVPQRPVPASPRRHAPAALVSPRRTSRRPLFTVAPTPPPPYPPGNRRGRDAARRLLRRSRNLLARFIFPGVSPAPAIPGMGQVWIVPLGAGEAAILAGPDSSGTTAPQLGAGVASLLPLGVGLVAVVELDPISGVSWFVGGSVRTGSPAIIRIAWARVNASDNVTPVAITPTNFQAVLTKPDGTTTTYVKADFTLISTGNFFKDITADIDGGGRYAVDAETTANTAFTDELGNNRTYFEVLDTAYLNVDP